MLLSLIVADAALELVPSKIIHHPSVVNQAKREGKKPNETLLDRSYHHAAMRGLPEAYRRGRPDIVHISLIAAIYTPLFLEDKLQVFVHTRDDKVITVGKGARLPKSYPRFINLMEQLFQQKKIVSEDSILLELRQETFADLLKRLKPETVIGLSRMGKRSSFAETANHLARAKGGALVIGGFPRGHFNSNVSKEFDQMLSVHEQPLEAHVVIARSIYELEKAFG
jgi:rRNA small subunit pseudouridine methyltransferase Nep1